MLPVGHIAYTWAGLAILQTLGYARDVDYRRAAVACLLPDLVDKPLSLSIMRGSGTSQTLGHTLLAHTLLTASIARAQRAWLPYALIANGHLISDQMWRYWRTLLFPFSRRFDTWRHMGTPAAMLRAYLEIATRPSVLAVEAVGVGLLAWFVRMAGLGRADRARTFIRTGRITLSWLPDRPARGTETLT